MKSMSFNELIHLIWLRIKYTLFFMGNSLTISVFQEVYIYRVNSFNICLI